MNGLDLLIRSYETMREKGTEGGLRDTLSLALRHTGAVCLRLELTEEGISRRKREPRKGMGAGTSPPL